MNTFADNKSEDCQAQSILRNKTRRNIAERDNSVRTGRSRDSSPGFFDKLCDKIKDEWLKDGNGSATM